MTAYIIKITLLYVTPEIWRRVIIPAGSTFLTLHNVIHTAMGWTENHYYDFDIDEEKLRITNDEELVQNYNFYSMLKLTEKMDPHGSIEKMLQIRPRLSKDVKIDEYFNRYKEIKYIYDFGDYWKHQLNVEELLNSYDKEYPLCIEGENACPPEDVGGPEGFAELMEIINNPKNPEYLDMKKWLEEQNYNAVFDISRINLCLENIK